MGEGCLGEQGDVSVRAKIEPVDVILMLDQVHGVGSDRHRADGFFVARVTDVEDRVALVGPYFELVVDLCHKRAAGVDHDPSS